MVVRQGEVVAEADEPGLAATLACLEPVRRAGPGAAMADRVVGRAAAWAALWAGVTSCFGLVVSRPAEQLLADRGLRVEADRRVESITGPDGRESCPFEQVVAEATDAEDAVERIRRLAARLQAQNACHD